MKFTGMTSFSFYCAFSVFLLFVTITITKLKFSDKIINSISLSLSGNLDHKTAVNIFNKNIYKTCSLTE